MKKLFVLFMVAMFVLSMAGNAWAAGWWRENPNDTINTVAGNGAEGGLGQSTTDIWSDRDVLPAGATSPHGGFASTSNLCKTCHAVHGALSDSFRLLKNNNRADECKYCHQGPAAASKYRLYAYQDLGITVRGEHTLGSTQVPDSGLAGNGVTVDNTLAYGTVPDRGTYAGDGTTPTLFCFSCHSVHGAFTIEDAAVGWWTKRILRSDPGILSGNGSTYNADTGLTPANVGKLGYGDGTQIDLTGDTQTVGSVQGVGSVKTNNTIRAGFCGGCHTKNYNFRQNEASGQDYSLQRGSHPLNTDGTLEVGGGAGVSGVAKASWTNAAWCGSCHAAPIEYGGSATSDADAVSGFYPGAQGTDFNGDATDPWNAGAGSFYAAGFPHQSESNKLLFDDVQEGAGLAAGITNDAYRAIDGMDGVCEKCHTEDGTFGGADGGVGDSF